MNSNSERRASIVTIQLQSFGKHEKTVSFSFSKDSTMRELLEHASQLLGFEVVSFYNSAGHRLSNAGDFPSEGVVTAYSTAYPQNTQKNIDERSLLDTKQKPKLFEVAVLGPPKVGKSALIQRYVNNMFSPVHKTTIQSSPEKRVEVRGRLYTVKMLDTAGQEDFHPMHSTWIEKKDAFVLALDVEKLDLKEPNAYFSLIKESYERPIVILAITKFDLVENSPIRETLLNELKGVKQIAEKNKWLYIETSSKTGMNVKEMFEMLIEAKNAESKQVASPVAPAEKVEPPTQMDKCFSWFSKTLCCRK